MTRKNLYNDFTFTGLLLPLRDLFTMNPNFAFLTLLLLSMSMTLTPVLCRQKFVMHKTIDGIFTVATNTTESNRKAQGPHVTRGPIRRPGLPGPAGPAGVVDYERINDLIDVKLQEGISYRSNNQYRWSYQDKREHTNFVVKLLPTYRPG